MKAEGTGYGPCSPLCAGGTDNEAHKEVSMFRDWFGCIADCGGVISWAQLTANVGRVMLFKLMLG